MEWLYLTAIVLLVFALVAVMHRGSDFRRERDDLSERLWTKCEIIVRDAYFKKGNKFVKYTDLTVTAQNKLHKQQLTDKGSE